MEHLIQMEQLLDDKDWKILNILQEHGEYTNRQIAKKLCLPITTVYNRIKKMHKDGVIENFTIKINHDKTGKNFAAYVLINVNLELLKQRKKTQSDLIAEIRKFYFVERVDIVSGITDLIVLVRVSDVNEFDTVLRNKLQLVDGVERTQSMIIIHSE